MFKARQFKRTKLFFRIAGVAENRKLGFIIFVILLIISAAGLFGYKVLTENKLTRFDVEAQNLSCTSSGEITVFVQKKNINYFYFKAEALENDLRKKFFCIGDIESEISYPDRLKLKITGRKGKFVVTSINTSTAETNPQIVLSLDQMNATQSTTEAFPPKVLSQILKTYKEASVSGMYLVDQEGVVFEEVTTDIGFPRLAIFSQDLKIGQKIPDDLVKKTAEILEKVTGLDLPVDNLIIVGDRLIIDSLPRIIFSLNKPLDRQTASLQLILAQAKMNLDPSKTDSKFIAPATSSLIESIDLRFDKPVVIYTPKKK